MTRPRSTDSRRRTPRQLAIARVERAAVQELARLKRVSFWDIRTLFNPNGSLKQGQNLAAAAAAGGATVTVRTQRAANGEVERVVTIHGPDKVAALTALLQRFELLTEG